MMNTVTIPWRRKWQSSSIFLLGKSQVQWGMVEYSSWGWKRVGHDLTIKQQQNNWYILQANSHNSGLRVLYIHQLSLMQPLWIHIFMPLCWVYARISQLQHYYYLRQENFWWEGRVCPGFLSGSDSKESACYVGDQGSTPGWGRSSGEGNGNPLWCSCKENSMDRGA